MRTLHATTLLGLCAATLSVAPAASAAVHCAPAPCAEGTPHATISAAVTAADADPAPDTVAIGPGVHNLGNDGLLVLQPTTELRGAGRDSTILTVNPMTGSDGFTRTIVSGYMSRLSDLTLRLPSAIVTANGSVQGADVYDGTVERVRVDALGASFGPGINDGRGDAMLVRSGSVRDVVVDFDPATDASGISAGANSGTVVLLEDVTVRADRPLSASPEAVDGVPRLVVGKRLRLTGPSGLSVSDGLFELSDSTIDVSGAPADAEPVAVDNYQGRAPNPTGITLDRVTLIGNGGPLSSALSVGGEGPGPATFLRARHVVATGFARTLLWQRYGGELTATIDYSNLDPALVATEGPGGGSVTLDAATGNRPGAALLIAPAAGDFRLGAGSPAVDIGGGDLLAGGATDLAGAPRPVDGDGDGNPLADAGAFEYQRVVPPAAVDRTAPTIRRLRMASRRFAVAKRRTPIAAKRAKPRRGSAFRFALSERATVRIAIQRRVAGRRVGGRCRAVTRANRGRPGCKRFVRAGRTLVRRGLPSGARRIAFSGRIGRRALRPGHYRATLTATDAAGNRSPARRTTFRIVRPPRA